MRIIILILAVLSLNCLYSEEKTEPFFCPNPEAALKADLTIFGIIEDLKISDVKFAGLPAVESSGLIKPIQILAGHSGTISFDFTQSGGAFRNEHDDWNDRLNLRLKFEKSANVFLSEKMGQAGVAPYRIQSEYLDRPVFSCYTVTKESLADDTGAMAMCLELMVQPSAAVFSRMNHESNETAKRLLSSLLINRPDLPEEISDQVILYALSPHQPVDLKMMALNRSLKKPMSDTVLDVLIQLYSDLSLDPIVRLNSLKSIAAFCDGKPTAAQLTKIRSAVAKKELVDTTHAVLEYGYTYDGAPLVVQHNTSQLNALVNEIQHRTNL